MSMFNDDVNRVLNWIENGTVELNECSMMDEKNTLVLTKYLTKTSASASEVAFGYVSDAGIDSPVAMKIWINLDEVELTQTEIDKILKLCWKIYPTIILDSKKLEQRINVVRSLLKNPKSISGSLSYEADVYRYVTDFFIKNDICNNFIPFLSLSSCSFANIFDAFEELDDDSLYNSFSIYEPVKDKLNLNILLTGTSSNIYSLENLLRTDTLTSTDMRAIIVQVLHALYCMESVKLSHNDLHLNNILIEILDSEENVTINKKTFSTRYIPKIYDWDFSYCTFLGNNPKFVGKGNQFNSLNIGNRFKKNADYYQFMCGLDYHRDLNSYFPGFVPKQWFKSWDQRTSVNIDYKLSVKEYMLLLDYIIKNNIEPDADGIIFIDMSKTDFLTMIETFNPSDVFRNDQAYKARFNVSNSIYFEFNIKQEKIVLLAGHACSPLFNQDDSEILYPLKKVLERTLKIVLNPRSVTLKSRFSNW